MPKTKKRLSKGGKKNQNQNSKAKKGNFIGNLL